MIAFTVCSPVWPETMMKQERPHEFRVEGGASALGLGQMLCPGSHSPNGTLQLVCGWVEHRNRDGRGNIWQRP